MNLGVKYHHRAGIAKIKKLIDAHVQKGNQEEVVAQEQIKEVETTKEKVIPKSVEEFQKEDREDRKKKAGALMRIRVQCMNPQKASWEGEIISVGSAKLGTFKRYVPFNNVEWHVPKIIYDMMKERQCSAFYTTRNELGHQIRKSRLINEFSIEVLPPLSKEEIKSLAAAQAAKAGQGTE